MVAYKTYLQSEKEIQHVRRKYKWRRWRCVIRKWQKFRKWSCSDSEIEEDRVEKWESSDSGATTPPPQKITKGEGWKWNVTGDRPSKLHFTGNPGIKASIIRNLPPEPNPLEVFQLMVHDSLWDEIATKQTGLLYNFMKKSQSPYNKPMVPYNFPWNKSLLCIMCPHVPSEKTKFAILLEHP